MNRQHHRFRRIGAVAMVVAVIAGMGVQSTSAVVEWELIDDMVALGMNGVSPHVEKTATGDRVWRSDGPAGTEVSMCNDAGTCTAETLSTAGGGPVNDFAVAQTANGMRAYFKRVDPQANTQAVYSAPCLTANCLSIGTATLTSPAMQVSKDVRAWGVPDPVRLPDGRVRIYLVESPDTSATCTEKIASYISDDGISFTRESGWRFEGGFVDSEVLRAKTGEWIMILADGPGCPAGGSRKLQQLYVSSSNDGLTWSRPQVLTDATQGRLDPTGYETSTNVFRIYYSMGGANNSYSIKRATLRIKQTPAGGVGITNTPKVTVPNKKSKTITCVKGKTVRKVTGSTCPKGFKKR
jgi:hypothetical protein